MLGDRLRELREAKELSQKELADYFTVSPSTIGMWERDQREPNIEAIKQLAVFYQVSTDYLLGRTDTRGPAQVNETAATYNADSGEIVFPPIDVGGKKLDIVTKRRDVGLALDDFLDTIKRGLEQGLLTEEQAETAIRRFHETLKTSIEIFRR